MVPETKNPLAKPPGRGDGSERGRVEDLCLAGFAPTSWASVTLQLSRHVASFHRATGLLPPLSRLSFTAALGLDPTAQLSPVLSRCLRVKHKIGRAAVLLKLIIDKVKLP